jgi:PKD repeat protein
MRALAHATARSNPSAMRRLIASVFVIAALAACIESTEPLPLGISIQKPATVTTADSASFVVTAQGNSLLGVETSFGDGRVVSFATSGARTATVTFRHRYTLSGTYDVTATVSDAVLGQKTAAVQVIVP